MEGYKEYHTSKDNLDIVSSSNLHDTLKNIWKSILILEMNEVYHPNYKGLPSMHSLGIYPYHLYPIGGASLNEQVSAYYELLGMVDGESDLIEISKKTNIDILHFINPVNDFIEKGLIHTT
jgi:aminopeptidase-like protein